MVLVERKVIINEKSWKMESNLELSKSETISMGIMAYTK